MMSSFVTRCPMAEVVCLCLAICGSLSLVTLYLIYRYAYAPFLVLKRLGVNGPIPSLFYGNAKDFWKYGSVNYMQNLVRQYGPVCGFYYGVRPIVVIGDPEMAKQILVKDFDSFADREHFVDYLRKRATKYRGLLQAKGNMWRQARQTISPSFSAMKLKAMVPLIQASCMTLADKFGECAASNQAIDVCKLYGQFTMETILAVAFGRIVCVQRGEADDLTTAAMQVFRSPQSQAGMLIPLILDQFPFLEPVMRLYGSRSSASSAYHHLQQTALELVKTRKAMGDFQKYKDLLQLMIDATDDSGGNSRKLTDEEIVTHSTTFLLAGYETTATSLAYTSYLLALHPVVQEKLHNEVSTYFINNQGTDLYDAVQNIHYLDHVIQESLRLYPPAPIATRQCTKTTEVGGVLIPKGMVVRIPIWTLHHDPQYWEEPEDFRPERFSMVEHLPMAHIPFGLGQRNCIGMRLALLTAKLAMIHIVRNYKIVQTKETEVPLTRRYGIVMAPKNGVIVRIEAR